jgi:hypothetical protein
MLNKLDYTQQILKQLPVDDRPSEEDALSIWWQDIRPAGGLRLSSEGCVVFNQLGIDSYEFDVPPSTPARANTLLILSNKLTCPYYIVISKKPRLVLFGSKEATMYSLYGDINRFIAAINHGPDVRNRV